MRDRVVIGLVSAVLPVLMSLHGAAAAPSAPNPRPAGGAEASVAQSQDLLDDLTEAKETEFGSFGAGGSVDMLGNTGSQYDISVALPGYVVELSERLSDLEGDFADFKSEVNNRFQDVNDRIDDVRDEIPEPGPGRGRTGDPECIEWTASYRRKHTLSGGYYWEEDSKAFGTREAADQWLESHRGVLYDGYSDGYSDSITCTEYV